MDDPQWPRASGWLASGGSSEADAPLLAVMGLPLSQASISPSQAHTTPAAVRAALRRFSTFAAVNAEGVDLERIQVVDLGDLPLAQLSNDEAQDLVAAGVAEAQDGPALRHRPDLLVLLGGDNSVTRPAMAAAMTDLAGAGLLTLDAHHDVRGWYAGRSNGTPVRGLVDDGLPGHNVVQIGIGAFTNSGEYRRYCDERGIVVVTASRARAEGVGPCVARHLEWLAQRCERIYVDLDIDVLDAAFAPGCPGARPGGLTPAELHAAAFEAGRHQAVAVIDIVEVDAQADAGRTTVDSAALCLLHAAAGLGLRRGHDGAPSSR